MNEIDKLPFAQRERLRFIDTLLAFQGHIYRKTIEAFFGVSCSAASRDLAMYKKLNPESFKNQNACRLGYERNDTFEPLFDHGHMMFSKSRRSEQQPDSFFDELEQAVADSPMQPLVVALRHQYEHTLTQQGRNHESVS